jgi:hypothetical protein
MAYTAPTPADLRARYPAFADVQDATVQYWLTDAERFVDETWIEGDYAPALMAHAAWQMSLRGLGVTSAVEGFGAGVTRFKSGDMDVTISDKVAGAAASGGVAAGLYEAEFVALRRRNFGGPRLVGCAEPVCCP